MKRLIVVPCNGIGNPMSTITRAAALRLAELAADKVELLGIGQLLGGIEEAVEMARRGPTLLIEGCSQRCATKLCDQLRVRPVAVVYLPDVVQKYRFRARWIDRKYLGVRGYELAELVALEALCALEKSEVSDRVSRE